MRCHVVGYCRRDCSPEVSVVFADGAGIVDGNLDAKFDVLWALILHYSVAIPMRERVLQHADHDASDRSPTQKFLLWVQGRVPEDIPVHNFTSDWKDGRPLGALIDSVAPGDSEQVH